MTVKSEHVTAEPQIIIDDLAEDKLAALKAKLAQKKEEMIKEKKNCSIRFGFVGTGQAGSKLAFSAYKAGYEAIAFNTASQDLEYIDLPEDNKYLLKYGLGGAAKDLEIGREAAETHKEAIADMVERKLGNCHMFMLCLSLGGGSGAGSCETMVDVLNSTGKPVIVLTALPMTNEDAQVKKNALETLSKLAKEVQNKRIANLIVVDNAKIESIYSNVSQIEFYDVSNKAIITPIDMFNTLSSMPSSTKALDPMEFSKIIVDGGGLSVYGEITVANYDEDTAIAEAIVENLNHGLLASGFDLKQSKYVGVMIVARKSVWSKIPSSSVNYAMAMISETCGTPNGTFKGIYTLEDMPDNIVKIYSFYSGLGLPDSRVQQLKKEVQELSAKVKDKDQERNLTLKLDTGTEETVSAADKVRQKIASRKSTFGSFINSTTQDVRKK